MREAIAEAKKQKVWLRCLLSCNCSAREIIGRGHNLREARQEATAHAEMYAIQEACRGIENWRLEETQLFVTLEPCPMCSGAMLLARIQKFIMAQLILKQALLAH